MSKKPLFSLQHISKVFTQGETALEILKDISLDLYPGKLMALVGSSGSGKSTLLHIAGLLEKPTSGEVLLEKASAWNLKDDRRTEIRLNQLGFVYQFHHLLPEFTALENVMLPQLMRGVSIAAAAEKAQRLLKALGLAKRATHRPARLSGGEQQRVAILRALANDPKVLLADEPTGNLDEKTAEVVFRELVDLVREHQIAALIATHDLSLTKKLDGVFHLSQGRLT